MTHPFHPLTGQRLPLLKRRVLDGTPMLQLQVGEDSVCLPESWTDRAPMAEPVVTDAQPAIVTPETLRELLDLVAALQRTGDAQRK